MVSLHSWKNHIIGIVAVILNEGTTIVVASEFYCIGVNLIDWGKEGLTVVDDHAAIWVVSGGGKLSVGAWSNLSVSTNDWEGNAVRVVVQRVDILLKLLFLLRRFDGCILSVS